MNREIPKIYLASKSPRRLKLLRQLNFDVAVHPVEVDEEFFAGEAPVDAVKRVAKLKLDSAKKDISEGIIISADTTVVLDNAAIAKPIDENDAFSILKKLSDREHLVHTGYAIFNCINKKEIVSAETTRVLFRILSDEEIWNYIASGSPMDKAGAYGIQDDFGAVFIKKIDGCYYNVVGLPLSSLYTNLKKIL